MIVTDIIGENTYTTDYRLSDTTWGKYDSGFHAYLVERGDPDDYAGDTDFGGAAIYGRRVDYWDTCGFHALATFETEAEANEAYSEFESAYFAWSDEDGEEN